jgi:hypothetical protein
MTMHDAPEQPVTVPDVAGSWTMQSGLPLHATLQLVLVWHCT